MSKKTKLPKKKKEKRETLMEKMAPHARKALASKQDKLKDTGKIPGVKSQRKAMVDDRHGPADVMKMIASKVTGK